MGSVRPCRETPHALARTPQASSSQGVTGTTDTCRDARSSTLLPATVEADHEPVHTVGGGTRVHNGGRPRVSERRLCDLGRWQLGAGRATPGLRQDDSHGAPTQAWGKELAGAASGGHRRAGHASWEKEPLFLMPGDAAPLRKGRGSSTRARAPGAPSPARVPHFPTKGSAQAVPPTTSANKRQRKQLFNHEHISKELRLAPHSPKAWRCPVGILWAQAMGSEPHGWSAWMGASTEANRTARHLPPQVA